MYRTFESWCAIFFLATLLAAQQKTKGDAAPLPTLSGRPPTEETVNAFMQQMFGYDPSVSWKIVEIKPASVEGLAEIIVTVSNAQGKQNNRLYVTADGKHALVGDIIPFGAYPFTEDREKLEKGSNGFSQGPANAPVTIFEFSDLQCPFCKQAQPKIDKLMAEAKDARLVFQSFPLASHNWAAKGAYYADCVGRKSNEAFWKFIHIALAAQSDITPENADEKLTALADQAGVKGKEVAECAAQADTASRVQHSIALGSSVEVNGTPTLFINGRKISNIGSNDNDGIPSSVLKGLVEFAAKQGK
jgi:protein-disulfide isomerase